MRLAFMAVPQETYQSLAVGNSVGASVNVVAVRTGVHGEVEQREPADDQAEIVAGPSLTSVANINSIVPRATAEACHMHWNAAEPLYDPKRTQAALSDRVR